MGMERRRAYSGFANEHAEWHTTCSAVCVMRRGRTIMWCVVLWLLPAVALAARAKQDPWVAVLAGVPASVQAGVVARMPAIRALHRIVLTNAHIAHSEPAQWTRRLRHAALLPTLQVGARHGVREDLDLSLSDEVSVSSSGVVVGPRVSDFAEQNNRHVQLDVRAVWRLNELLFNPDAIFVHREARERRREVRVLLHDANQLYFTWQRWETILQWAGRSAEIPATLARAERDMAAAELDALTGGWFSRQLQSAKRR